MSARLQQAEAAMTRIAWVALSLLFPLTASAGPPEISIRLTSAPPSALAAQPAQVTCAVASIAPVGWRDASDGRALATHPTARLDAQEQHSLVLASLVELRIDFFGANLFVLGAPARAGEELTLWPQPGWRPRWPFC